MNKKKNIFKKIGLTLCALVIAFASVFVFMPKNDKKVYALEDPPFVNHGTYVTYNNVNYYGYITNYVIADYMDDVSDRMVVFYFKLFDISVTSLSNKFLWLNGESKWVHSAGISSNGSGSSRVFYCSLIQGEDGNEPYLLDVNNISNYLFLSGQGSSDWNSPTRQSIMTPASYEQFKDYYSDGYADGYADGSAESTGGYDIGYEDGYNAGYISGVNSLVPGNVNPFEFNGTYVSYNGENYYGYISKIFLNSDVLDDGSNYLIDIYFNLFNTSIIPTDVLRLYCGEPSENQTVSDDMAVVSSQLFTVSVSAQSYHAYIFDGYDDFTVDLTSSLYLTDWFVNIGGVNYKILPSFSYNMIKDLFVNGYLAGIDSVESGSSDYYIQGYNAGYSEGYSAGSSAGFSESYNSGYSNGKADGIIAGKNQVWESRYNAGLQDGLIAGKQAGYTEGLEDALEGQGIYTFNQLFGSVLDAPVQTFSSLFNWELLGVNLLSLITALITIIIILKIVSIIRGR